MDTMGNRLRLLYPDIHGLERGKYLFGEVAAGGLAAFCVGVYPLTHDREILMVPNTQFDVGLHDVEARLDRDSLRPGWEDDTTVGIADMEHHGQPVGIDPRHVLREAIAAWRAIGLEPQVSFELEFYLMERDGADRWVPISLPAHRVYGTGMSIDPSGTVDAMVRAALACGFQIESWSSEYDEAAFEVNIRYADALTAADDAFLFRLLVREIAEQHGRLATFLGRPANDRGGSGMHVTTARTPSTIRTTPKGSRSSPGRASRACSRTTRAWPRSWRRM
jgi:glutamine synthetase